MHAGLHQAGGDDRGGPADRARGVHAQQRLAGGAERVGEHQFGHHHALEQVGRLAEHHGVDVGPVRVGVGHGAVDRLPAEPRDRDVRAA
jgi:hypothetical protein